VIKYLGGTILFSNMMSLS